MSDAATATTNPQSQVSFADVFGKLIDTTATLGGNYLTAQAQVAIAQKQLDAQQRLNGYSAVNPSLGAVNPAAATLTAMKTPVQSWLPNGSPFGSTSTDATGKTTTTTNWFAILGVGAVLIVGLVVLIRFIRK